MKVAIYTDGACKGNPGPGAWAAILVCEKDGQTHTKCLTGTNPNTTNNRMELEAAVSALAALRIPGQDVTIMSDSLYVVRAVNGGNNYKNLDLIQRLKEEMEKQKSVTAVHIRGHNGHPYNEQCDRMAHKAVVAALAA